MNSIQQVVINSQRSKFKRPTATQDAAFRRYISPLPLTTDNVRELAQHPWLSQAKKEKFAVMVASGAVLATEPMADAPPNAYVLGQVDASRNAYAPPSCDDTVQYDAYLKGWNDEWAKRNNATWWSRNQ